VNSRKISAVSKILAYQLLIGLIISTGFVIFKDYSFGISSVLGNMAAFIPNLFFALVVNRSAGRSAKNVLNSFYIGEVGKLLLTGILFMIIFKIPNIEILALLVGYITALSVFWFALLMR
jgi:ATP synthase protein I